MSANIKSVNINQAWKFPNGVFIFHADGSQVNPTSDEGVGIQAIFNEQHKGVIANILQKIRFAWTTFPREPTKRAQFLQHFGIDPNSPAPTDNTSVPKN